MLAASQQVRGELSELAIEVRRIEQERDDARATNARLRATVAQLESALRREQPAPCWPTCSSSSTNLTQQCIREFAPCSASSPTATTPLTLPKATRRTPMPRWPTRLDASKVRESSLRNRIASLEAALDGAKSAAGARRAATRCGIAPGRRVSRSNCIGATRRK
jgi:septal ring factor EnvC (AmiA/AmiB activator)